MEMGRIGAELTVEVSCPSCGEVFAALAYWEAGAGEEITFVEDCQVCCRPATIQVRIEDGVVVAVEAVAA